MTMPVRIAVVLVAAVCAVPAGATEDTATFEDVGRYVLQPAGDGVIRLDTKTGALVHCNAASGSWTCRPLDAPDVERPGDTELARRNRELTRRVADLERQLKKLRSGPAPSENRLQLPSDEEMDQVMSFFEKFVKRFWDFARTLDEPADKEI